MKNEDRYQEGYISLSDAKLSRNSDILKLDLSNNELYDLELLRFFPNLKELDLSFSYNLGDNYQAIKYVPKLESLKIDNTGLTTAKYLVPLKNLKYLEATFSNIGKAVKHLAKLPSLENLNILGGTEGIEELGRLVSLKKLTLKGEFNNYGESDDFYAPPIDFLTSLVNLRELDLSYNDYIEFIEPVSRLPNLQYLDLTCNKGIRDAHTLRGLTSLVVLNLKRCSTYMPTLENDLIALTELPNLKELRIDNYITPPKFNDQVRVIMD